MLQCAAVCCSVIQWVAAWCSVLQSCERVMLQVRISHSSHMHASWCWWRGRSHVTYMDESCHVYELVIYTYKCVMELSGGKESCHIFERVMSHVWISHLKWTNVSWCWWRGRSHVTHMNESYMYEFVMPNMRIRHGVDSGIGGQESISQLHGSFPTREWVTYTYEFPPFPHPYHNITTVFFF